ncbi:MAG: LptF/LptG family permease [Verrucomicrobiota bacterium]|nr:LptF/LptG family permease [Verrucomicrobiota bacterium]
MESEFEGMGGTLPQARWPVTPHKTCALGQAPPTMARLATGGARRMRTLHLYLTRETLATLLMTVLVFTFVLLLGNLFKEIAALIASGQVAPGFLLKAIGLLIPYVLVFSLPMGMLTATLLVFGRFSADHELTAARAGGISLLSLSAPVLAIGVLMSALSGWMNLQVAPQCRVAYKTMLFEYGLENTAALLTEKGFTDFPDHRVYVGSISGDTLRDVVVYQHDEAGNLKLRMHAEEASLGVDAKTEQVMLTLRSVDGFEFSDGKERTFVYAKYGPMALGKKTEASKQRPPKLKELGFGQLRARIAELKQQGKDPTPAQIQLHQKVALSFACIGFTLIGIPLAIRTHRRETNIGIAMALVLVTAYYGLIVLGQALEGHPGLLPHLWMWVPNFLFQGIGCVLLWKMNRGI